MKLLLCCSRTESFNSFLQLLPINIREALWHIGWVDALGPKGHGFESHSSRLDRDLGILTYSCLLQHFGVLTPTVSIAVVGSASK